jgi:mucin-19
MPPVAAIAVGVLAGAPLFAGGASLLGLAGATAASILDTTLVVGDIVGGTVVGAGVGAAGAAITGGDPAQGALFGGLSGGLTTGLTPEVQSLTGLPSDASQAITTAGVSDALRVAQGQNLGAATEAGLVSGVGSYAGSQLKNFINQQTAPTADLAPVQVTPQTPLPGIEVGSYNQQTAPTGAAGGSNADLAPVQVTPQTPLPGIENVTVFGQRPPPSQNDLSLAQAINFGGNVLGKTAIGAGGYALDALLGGNSYYQPSAGTTNSPSIAPSGSTLASAAPGSATSSPGSAPGAATAVAGQTGQAGGTSIYAPGSPIFGDNGSVTKPGVWNTASLRTPQAEGA